MREEESFILESFSWPWPAKVARRSSIFVGGVEDKVMREWRKEWGVEMRANGEEVWPAKLLIKRESGGCLLMDWVGWEVASSLIVLVGRLACGGRI